MECQAIHSWTFVGLVGAFLDLSVTYFLLCASTLAFFASKFLGFFGLCLPCPCNGLFGIPNSNYCLQRLLVDYPSENISSVQFSVKSKFPFDSIWAKDQTYKLNLKLIEERDNSISGFVEMEGEASCSSISNPEKPQNLVGGDLVKTNEFGFGVGVLNSSDSKQERFDLKGKGVMNQRPRSGFRRRRKGSVDYGKLSSVSSWHDHSFVDVQGGPQSPSSVNKEEMIKGNLVLGESSGSHYNGVAVAIRRPGERVSYGFESDEPLDERKLTEKDVSSIEEYRSNKPEDPSSDGNGKNEIRVLEQALEEEHASRAALYLELEKERSAAASAADEAMAMILRLQEEKASIEMEARQYQRIIEEKSAYDAEEMNIMKEILVRREREKHFLEKEVEAYRQTGFPGNEQLEGALRDMEDPLGEQLSSSSLDLSEDPILILHQLSNSIGKKEMEKKRYSRYGKQGIPGFQEKGMLYMDVNAQTENGASTPEQNFLEKIVSMEGEVQDKNDHANLCPEIEKPTLGTCDETEIHISVDGEGSGRHGKDGDWEKEYSRCSMVDTELRVHDVHVIDNESNLRDEICENRSDLLPDTSNIHRESNFTSESSEIPSSSTIGWPPIGSSRCKALTSDLRRNSISVVDSERLKIDTEVKLLREKLRVVQEGREKLNFSVEHREREKVQLQLLEDIARQLREIRQLTEPEKALRQASLPPPSTKVMLKKRRSRSVSLGVHKSS